jgi:tetratricopeptide (TPR) repeat protein
MNNKINGWDLIKLKKFEEAYSFYDNEYEKHQRKSDLGKRAVASLNLKNYKDALKGFLELIRLNNGDSDADYIYAGTCYWILGNKAEAINLWKEGLTSTYTDAAGGIEIPATLFFAAISLGNQELLKEAVSLLRKRWKAKSVVNWPGAIAGYLLGKFSEQEVLEAISDHPTLRIREMCQALFYFGIQCLKNGDRKGFISYMEQCSSSEYGYLEQEYYLAIGELDKYKI